ncbi:putative glycine cleavage T protein [Actinacidiphila reveromycinica]|uniref:Putative glycine cleavage T protein n=1 Tax=Actinacidiphila reveromycinica TaxID=659352 RepID=A0A7U3VLM2_9ACTN|nr:aminomethyl transferase family protein [Streptomyces sp. SN-593]BBA95683.1 putative glycine cleavage T protein [Streptomyces sp. SN-593]
MDKAIPESLQAAIDRVGNAVDLIRDQPIRAFSHGLGFVPREFTNWREEALAWHTSCALMDQSHHMTDLFIEGPDTVRLLEHLGVNSFAGFGNDKAKQFVAVNGDGHYIGDAVLFGLGDTSVDLVGRRTVIDWVEFNARSGDWDVTLDRDPQSVQRGGRPPRLYRFEVQGPSAGPLVEKLTGQPIPDVRFFGMATLSIAGHRARAVRHGMAGQVGFELFGPWEEGAEVYDAILRAGEEFGIKRVGSVAYSTANLESGWIPGPLPAIFTGDDLAAYRAWLPATSAGSLGGSMASKDITDYYVTPYDLGYGRLVKFDHDFVGRDALRARAELPHRHKVTLVWHPDDAARLFSSLWTPGPTYKYFDIPKARYGQFQMDAVLAGDRQAGISMDCGYVVRDQAVVSLAVVDEEFARPGTEVRVLWGESPCSAKPTVEPHDQVEVRATVESAPLDRFARTKYRAAAQA